MNEAPRALDFITRLADAWDGRNNAALQGAEKRALWELARLPPWPREQLAPLWRDIEPKQRQSLVFAARQAVNLGRAIALQVFAE